MNVREFGASQANGAQSLQQHVGKGSDPQADLIGIGGIFAVIYHDPRFDVGSHDSADLTLRFGMKYSGW